MTYWFAAFSATFFALYWIFPIAPFRRALILLSSAVFLFHFSGPAGVLPIFVLGLLTYISGISSFIWLKKITIAICVMALIFYKYTLFLSLELISFFDASIAITTSEYLKASFLPDVPPLAISFFVFEFVHYLIDTIRGEKPIKSIVDFGLFSLFWPSMVAGPIKRYEQFIPALRKTEKVPSEELMYGMIRVAVGLIKKFIADNLTSILEVWTANFDNLPMSLRWACFLGYGLRILLDFSGYSDIAIGFARMMGVKIPENFNWPYLARSPIDFWHRWHISLSTWIRDYVYIPLGGGRQGLTRKIINVLFAFSLCGLWHGAGWNFIFWGAYHGAGVGLNNLWREKFNGYRFKSKISHMLGSFFAWAFTLLFVMVGWVFFFFPLEKASHILGKLLGL